MYPQVPTSSPRIVSRTAPLASLGAVVELPRPRALVISPPRQAVRPAVLSDREADLLSLSLMFVFVCASMTLSTLTIVSGELQQRFGLTGAQIGLLTSVFMGFYGVSGLVSGLFASRWGGRLLVVTCASFFVGSLLLGLGSGFSCFLVGRAIQGIGGGTVVSICNPLMTNSLPAARMRRCWGVFGCGWGIGQMATLLVMPTIARAGGYRAVFLTMAALALAAAAATLSQRAVRALPRDAERCADARVMAASLLAAVKIRGFCSWVLPVSRTWPSQWAYSSGHPASWRPTAAPALP